MWYSGSSVETYLYVYRRRELHMLQQYHLLSCWSYRRSRATGGFVDCFDQFNDDKELCDSSIAKIFAALPGVNKLDGNQWGGVIKDDFVIG